MNTDNNDIWIALISAGGTLITALGLGKLVPDYLERRKEKERLKQKAIDDEKSEREERERKMLDKINELTLRMESMEDEVQVYRTFKLKTETAFNSMIPLMKEMMKDHPNHIAMLDQLKHNIFGDLTPTDGENHD